MANPLDQYKQQMISTMSSGDQLIALYNGAIKNINIAVMLYENKDYKNAEVCTQKTKAIFDYLITVLDFNIPISGNLYKLYNFFKQEIALAEVKRKGSPLTEILPLIVDLKETWLEAQKLTHMNK